MLTGSFTALVTPFDAQGKLDLIAYKRILSFHKAFGCLKVAVLGTTGERMSLSDEEESLVIQAAVEEGFFVVVGSGCNCTEKSVSRSEVARKLGVKAVLAIVPYYNKPPFRGIEKHFKAIAEVGLPVILYHNPARTGTRLTVDELKAISQIDGIEAIKEASGDLVFAKKLIETVNVPVLCGDDILTLEMLKLGAKGTLSVVSNVIPSEWNRMVELGLKSEWDKARAIEAQYKPLIEALGLEVNPIGIKYVLSLMGLCSPSLRLPLCEPLPETKRAIEDACKADISGLRFNSLIAY